MICMRFRRCQTRRIFAGRSVPAVPAARREQAMTIRGGGGGGGSAAARRRRGRMSERSSLRIGATATCFSRRPPAPCGGRAPAGPGGATGLRRRGQSQAPSLCELRMKEREEGRWRGWYWGRRILVCGRFRTQTRDCGAGADAQSRSEFWRGAEEGHVMVLAEIFHTDDCEGGAAGDCGCLFK